MTLRAPKVRPSLHLEPAALRAIVDTHPDVVKARTQLREGFKVGDAEARSFTEQLLKLALDRFGEHYIDQMTARIKRIVEARERAANVLDEILDGSTPNAADGARALEGIYKQLKEDLEGMRSPSEHAKASPKLADEDFNLSYFDERAAPNDVVPYDGPIGRHAEIPAAMRTAVDGLPTKQRTALAKAARLAPAELWRVLAAETESGFESGMKALEGKIADGMPPAERATLREAAGEVGKRRNASQRKSPVSMEGTMRAEAVRNIDDAALRKVVSGNRYLELLAAENPEMLADLWEQSPRKTKTAFTNYVRGRMVTHIRGMLGEFTAAFVLGERGMGFLKGPDYDVTIPGTDLVGITKDGRVWIIDNKAESGTILQKVGSLIRNFARNLGDDVTEFKGSSKLKRSVDARAALAKMEAALKEVKKVTKDMTPEQVADPAVQKLIDEACRRAGVDRVVTNAAGNITGLTASIEQAGVILADLNRVLASGEE